MSTLIDWLLGRPDPSPDLEERALGGTNIPTVEVWPGYVVPVTEAYNYSRGYAVRLPAAYRARLMTANTIAQLPVEAAGRTNIPSIVRRPDPDITRGEFIRQTILSLVDYGNAYWQLVPARTGTSRPIALRVLNPPEMSVSWAGTTQDVRTYEYRLQTMRHGSTVWHLSMGRGRGDLTGVGPMQHSRLAGVAAALDYLQQYFLGGAFPSGILKSEGDLSGPEAEAMRARWLEQHAPGTRTPAVLSGDISYEDVGLGPKDSDWVNTHGAGILDTAQIFGIPARLLGYTQAGSSLTYANVTDVYLSWWRETLQPDYVAVIEEAWSEVAGVDVRFDPLPLIRGDAQARWSAYQTAIAAGVLTVNEARELEGLPPTATPTPAEVPADD